MQESIFDIFGSRLTSVQPTVRPLPSNTFQTVKGEDNVRLKASSVSGLPSSKKALGDVGNKMKSFPDSQESRKLLSANYDQENYFPKPMYKTPLSNKKPVAPKKETPNLKSTVRTPLSDVKTVSSVSKQSFQNSSESTVLKSGGKNLLLSEISLFEDLMNGDAKDLSWMQPDDVEVYEPVDNYEDIIPNSLRPSEEDIQRVVRFWDMHTDPLESDFEIGPFLPVIEELDNGFGQVPFPDVSFDDDVLPVPVPPTD